MSSTWKTLAYELHLFGQICTSQIATEIAPLEILNFQSVVISQLAYNLATILASHEKSE